MNIRDKLTKLGGALRRWEYLVGILGIVLTVLLGGGAVIFFWEDVRALEHYGYLGAFIISVFGGATILAPVPMTPVIFALGTVMRPSFAPYLGPVFVGAAAGLGETVGGLFIYMTGRGGGAALYNIEHEKIRAIYLRMLELPDRKGG